MANGFEPVPFFFNPPWPAILPQRDEDGPQVLSAVSPAGRRITPTDRVERNRETLAALPANEPVMPATGEGGGGFGNILRSALPAALFGLGAGASIRRGNITPLINAGSGYLSGLGEREQREAEALAEEEKRRQAARKAKLEEQKLRQSLQPEFRFSRGGFTGTFTPEAVPESVFGQPLKPEAREREERDRLEKGFLALEEGFKRLPVEPEKSDLDFIPDARGGGWIFDQDRGTFQYTESGPGPKPPAPVKMKDGSWSQPITDQAGRTIGFEPIAGGEAPPSSAQLTAAERKELRSTEDALSMLTAYEQSIDSWLKLSERERIAARAGSGHQDVLGAIRSNQRQLMGMMRASLFPGPLSKGDEKILNDIIGTQRLPKP